MKHFVAIVLCCLIHRSINCQTITNLIKIVADDRAEKNCFGWSTGIYGNYCVVATPTKGAKKLTGHRLLQEGGGAYIFTKNTKGNWIQTQLLLPDTPKALDFFGGSVSLYDDYLAVCANGDDNGADEKDQADSRQGAVYIYKLDRLGKWNKTQKIILENRNPRDNFGYKVCLYKNRLAISATHRSFSDSKFDGAVYIYEKSSAGGWVQKHIIKCPEKDIYFFGSAIAIFDSLLVVGGMNSKNAFVYKLNKNDKWNLIKKLNATNKSDVDFGSSVGVRNNMICIGANGSYERPDEFSNHPDTIAFREKHLLGSGSVHIYEIDSKNNVNFKQRIIAKDIKADMHFGMCMTITDSLLVVGAFGDAMDVENLANNLYAGAAYVFKRNKTGEWVEARKIVSPQRSIWDKFAFSVSAHEKTVIIGSRFEDEDAQEKHSVEAAGAAYIYEDK